MELNLELERCIEIINKKKAKTVVIQLPDGLKTKAGIIADQLRKKTKAEILIYLGSCYGACDIPTIKGADLLIQWGHNEYL
jgi:2-(3-amino-3-carboxypropyl)histidine synthase